MTEHQRKNDFLTLAELMQEHNGENGKYYFQKGNDEFFSDVSYEVVKSVKGDYYLYTVTWKEFGVSRWATHGNYPNSYKHHTLKPITINFNSSTDIGMECLDSDSKRDVTKYLKEN